MGETEIGRFMRLRNQLVIGAENFGRDENLFPVLIPTISKDMEEQLELAHKVVDVVDGANREIWVTPLRYSADKPERFYAQVRFSARKKKFQQNVYVNHKLEENIYLLYLMNSVHEKNITNQRICNVL